MNFFSCAIILFLYFIVVAPSCAQDATAIASRQRMDFDAGWRFHPGDPVEMPKGQLDYDKLKDFMLATGNDLSKGTPVTRPSVDVGSNVSFVKPDFNDQDWRLLDLPHDWAIEGPFDIKLPGETAKLKYWGQGWYRKHFILSPTDRRRCLFLDVDGAMSYSSVWVNGKLAGGWAYGYSSYEIDLTPYVNFGSDNVIAIRLDNPPDSSRWYPGAGIYRNVWLAKTSPIHVGHWSTAVTTPDVSASSATVALTGNVRNQGTSDAQVTVVTGIFELDANDKRGASPVAEIPTTTCSLPVGGSQNFSGSTQVRNPKLWDTTNPQRYVALTRIEQDGKVLDEYETPFGIRSVKFDANRGFLLNGQRVPLNGVCGHQDLGALGIAFNTRAAERQLQILKEAGVNALRTAHNMPTPELLDLCDKMGILVMDESFDCWRLGKKGHDYAGLFDDWHERDIRAEVRRDRNHPSVIIWSMGNEIYEQGQGDGIKSLASLAGIVRQEDTSRAVAQGTNHAETFDPAFLNLYDAIGVNYYPDMYAGFHKKYPHLPLFSSESASACSSRGVYFLPPDDNNENFQVNSYGRFHCGWGTSPEEQFKQLEQNSFVAGEFVWTGFDYLGEPTPYNADPTNLLNFRDNPAMQAKLAEELKEFGKIPCPARSSYFGMVDLAGFKKDRFYLYQAHWRSDLPMVHILPQWNWAGHEGQNVPVYVYTSGDEVELFLNGTSLGRKKLPPFTYKLQWDHVAYAPGVLKAVAYKAGKQWAETSVQTTGEPAAIQLEADRDTIRGDGKDLSFITTRIVDSKGLTVPTAQNRIKYEIVSGPGQIVATDNGDATDLETFSQSERQAFNGLALTILRGQAGQTGDIRIRATSDGLSPAEVTIHLTKSGG
jgi:beta-galactosidase